MDTSKWDRRFMSIAEREVGSWSKDDVGVGCVIVDQDRNIRVTGYNGPPRGCVDSEDRFVRPFKDWWMVHAELNAVFTAARVGTSLRGCTAYATKFPCTRCAAAFIQAGICKLVTYAPDFGDTRWGDEWVHAYQMLKEAHIIVVFMDID